MKQMIKLGLTLSAYAVAACLVLALTNNFTKPFIEERAQAELKQSLGEVFSEAASFEEIKVTSNGVTNYYEAKNSAGDTIGAVVVAEGKTYDHAKIAIGFKKDSDLTITGMKFLELSDSPGFGQRAADPNEKVKSGKTFYGQFAGKKASDGFTVNKTYDAVSGATITSTSVGRILTNAANCAKRNLLK
ncbi:MAG: FMN-binding protein [Treponema sp.]|nr:FMN-binding protein [Candidatus Treponema equifaecale]